MVKNMTKRDIAVIESAKDVMEYCKHVSCEDCIFHLAGGDCISDLDNPARWEFPELKTYKQDFLSKFPNANFESSNICRKMVYGEEHDCRGKTCQECWDEVYMEK